MRELFGYLGNDDAEFAHGGADHALNRPQARTSIGSSSRSSAHCRGIAPAPIANETCGRPPRRPPIRPCRWRSPRTGRGRYATGSTVCSWVWPSWNDRCCTMLNRFVLLIQPWPSVTIRCVGAPERFSITPQDCVWPSKKATGSNAGLLPAVADSAGLLSQPAVRPTVTHKAMNDMRMLLSSIDQPAATGCHDLRYGRDDDIGSVRDKVCGWRQPSGETLRTSRPIALRHSIARSTWLT